MGNNISNDDFWAELDRRIVDARTERKLFIEEITSLRQQLASFKESYQVLRCTIEQALALSNDGSHTLARKVLQRVLNTAPGTLSAPAATTDEPLDLGDGEIYLGIQSNSQGQLYHLILLPGDIKANWSDAMEWANEQGGDLPNCIELNLLWETNCDHFQKDGYWCNETRFTDVEFAWCQLFNNGQQGTTLKRNEFRARAVRRVAV